VKTLEDNGMSAFEVQPHSTERQLGRRAAINVKIPLRPVPPPGGCCHFAADDLSQGWCRFEVRLWVECAG
jgi:hypothetical protein